MPYSSQILNLRQLSLNFACLLCLSCYVSLFAQEDDSSIGKKYKGVYENFMQESIRNDENAEEARRAAIGEIKKEAPSDEEDGSFYPELHPIDAGLNVQESETLWEAPRTSDPTKLYIDVHGEESEEEEVKNAPLTPNADQTPSVGTPAKTPVLAPSAKEKATSSHTTSPQKEKPGHTNDTIRAITKGDYVVNIGDQFVAGVYGDSTTRRLITVDPTGSISYLFVNNLYAAGKTIGEIRHELQEKLKKYYRDPLVAITLTMTASDFYSVLGEVRQPGRFKIRGNATILTALAEAGGFKFREYRFETYDQADLRRSFLARNGEFYPVDFERLVRQGDMSQNVRLQAGDYIHITPLQLDKIYILGEVRRPTTMEYLHTARLTEALAEAGGITLRASSRAVVLRGSLSCPTHYLIDINRIQKGYASDFTLQPGDIVYVPAYCFTTAKEIIQSAIRTFVGTVASAAGTRAFISTTPDAANDDLIQPVPFINPGGITTGGAFAIPVQ